MPTPTPTPTHTNQALVARMHAVRARGAAKDLLALGLYAGERLAHIVQLPLLLALGKGASTSDMTAAAKHRRRRRACEGDHLNGLRGFSARGFRLGLGYAWQLVADVVCKLGVVPGPGKINR